MDGRCKETGRFVRTKFTETEGNIDSIGIYRITCKPTGRYYIGACVTSFRLRWHKHLSSLRSGKHGNRHLLAAFKKYGEDAFEFSIEMDCAGKSEDFVWQEEEKILVGLDIQFCFNKSKSRQGTVDRTRFSEKECQEIIEKYLTGNFLVQDMADELKCTRGIVYSIINGKYKNSSPTEEQKKLAKEVGKKAITTQHAKGKRKLTEEDAGKVKWIAEWCSRLTIADYFGINTGTVHNIVHGRSYKNAEPVPCPELIPVLGEKLSVKQRPSC